MARCSFSQDAQAGCDPAGQGAWGFAVQVSRVLVRALPEPSQHRIADIGIGPAHSLRSVEQELHVRADRFQTVGRSIGAGKGRGLHHALHQQPGYPKRALARHRLAGEPCSHGFIVRHPPAVGRKPSS